MKHVVYRSAPGAVTALVLSCLSYSAQANTETVLHSFTGTPDGAQPYDSQLMIDASRAIYGTTYVGGIQCSRQTSCGTVFKLVRDASGTWQETVLFAFNRIGKGVFPWGTLIEDANGALYGVTSGGGVPTTDLDANGGIIRYGGVVFKLTPPARSGAGWTETALYKFMGHSGKFVSDGARPRSLISDGAGGFYGTTDGGGDYYGGTIFHLTPPLKRGLPWTEAILHSFNGPTDGLTANGPLILDAKGNLYGTAQNGGTFVGDSLYGGTAFMMSPGSGGSWTFSVLHRFNCQVDGCAPGAPIMDASGSLYGTISGFRAGVGAVIYKLSPAANGGWTETMIFTGPPPVGALPTGNVPAPIGLIFDRGNLYLPNYSGGQGCKSDGNYGCGVISKLIPGAAGAPWTSSIIYTFQGTPDGENPSGNLVAGTGGGLYGMTRAGGTDNLGTVFKVDP
jgi:uncharacterized repeat protein (TIGR03803 family)